MTKIHTDKPARNLYVCESGHRIGIEHREDGTTPFKIFCPFCGGRAESKMYTAAVPNALVVGHWVAPTSSEITRATKQEAAVLRKRGFVPLSAAGHRKTLKKWAAEGGLVVIWDRAKTGL